MNACMPWFTNLSSDAPPTACAFASTRIWTFDQRHMWVMWPCHGDFKHQSLCTGNTPQPASCNYNHDNWTVRYDYSSISWLGRRFSLTAVHFTQCLGHRLSDYIKFHPIYLHLFGNTALTFNALSTAIVLHVVLINMLSFDKMLPRRY